VTDLARALELAEAAAREAGDLLRADFERPGGPRGSGDKAEADVEAERLIRARLLAAFPGWGYLGEETGRGAGEPGAPVWLVDPNDGTRDYLRGARGSSVSIGLAFEGRAVLGVVHPFAFPDGSGTLYAWAEGQRHVSRNGVPRSATPPRALTARDVVLTSSGAEGAAEGNLRCAAPARFRAVPSIAHRLAMVAAGEAAAATSLFAPCAWDYGGGHALLRGAGGVLLDEAGRPVAYAPDGGSNVRFAFAGSEEVARSLSERPWSRIERAQAPPVRVVLRRGEVEKDAARLSRAQGCLLGQVAGDSLGSLVEFESSAAIAAQHGDGPRQLDDGGVWGTLAGQPTDDSEMALALARSILERGRFDAEAAGRAYREWLASGPFDVGVTTRSGLSGRPRPDSQANGSLMRASPLGVYGHQLPVERLAELARADARLTHPHPVCEQATAAFVIAIARAVCGEGAAGAHAAALAWAEREGAAEVVERLQAAREGAPVCDGDSQGWVLIALQNAFHELLHAAGPEQALVRSVRRGGDTDTNAAIAGALQGAVHGRDALPFAWRQLVLTARALAGVAQRARPAVYWPVDVCEIAERLLLAGRAAASRA